MTTPSNISFLLAMLVTNEIALQTAQNTTNFIKQILRTYTSSKQWNDAKNSIQLSTESFQIGVFRLPCLNLETRAAAKRELKVWSDAYHDQIRILKELYIDRG
jgi:hypothetical protein